MDEIIWFVLVEENEQVKSYRSKIKPELTDNGWKLKLLDGTVKLVEDIIACLPELGPGED